MEVTRALYIIGTAPNDTTEVAEMAIPMPPEDIPDNVATIRKKLGQNRTTIEGRMLYRCGDELVELDVMTGRVRPAEGIIAAAFDGIMEVTKDLPR